MPKKQNLAMLEGPPEQKTTAYIGPPYRTLPPIGSTPPTGRQPKSSTPRKLSTAPGMAKTTAHDGERPSYSRSNSMPPEMSESAQYRSVPSTRQTVKTDGEVTVIESVGSADGRDQPRAGGRGQPRADRQLNSEDGFFMTQVRILLSFTCSKDRFDVVLHRTHLKKIVSIFQTWETNSAKGGA